MVGAVPGLLWLHHIAPPPCWGSDGQQDGGLNGQVLAGIASITAAGVGYTLGTAYGARTGSSMAAVSRGAPVTATAWLLAVQF